MTHQQTHSTQLMYLSIPSIHSKAFALSSSTIVFLFNCNFASHLHCLPEAFPTAKFVYELRCTYLTLGILTYA